MNIGTIINFFLIIGAIQGFIFIGITFFMRKRIERTVLFLNLFILFLSLNNLQSWFLESKLIEDPLGYHWSIPWYIMIVPMFYSFLLHYLNIERKRKTLLNVSFLLFTIACFIKLSLVWAIREDKIKPIVLENYTIFEDCFVLLYSIGLYVLCIYTLKKQQRLFESILSFDNLKWVRRFLRLGGGIFILWGIAVYLNIFSETIKAPDSYYPLRLLSSILIYWVGYQGFFQYVVLKERIALRELFESTSYSHAGEHKNTQGGNRQKISFVQVDEYVLQNKSYLNPQLSLESLAQELNIGLSTLSKLINDQGRSNFSDYVNRYRIEEAKSALTNLEYANYTIVAIGLECGFNSKSAFYTAFKKEVGISPTAFRNQELA